MIRSAPNARTAGAILLFADADLGAGSCAKPLDSVDTELKQAER
ncbi:hypothetical protein [Mesorhizobium sp.]|nr:hypothetical protein [Mesorhizobium sp.]